jgi:hypothetical protein
MPSVGKRSVAKGHQKGREKTVRTGSKVVCVDDRFPPEIIAFYNHLPIKDRHYTIRGVGIGISTNGEPGEVVVYLEGLPNPCSSVPPHPERGFAQHRFREIEPPVEAEIEELEEAFV